MGLLDPKTRIFDVCLTDVGREALANNSLTFEYYSLSDGSLFYENDLSGSSDVTSRIYAECPTSLPQDVLSLLTDDSGHLIRVKSSAMTGSIVGGHIMSGAYNNATVLSGSLFASTAGLILSSSLENLRNNFIIGTVDDFFEDDDFKVGPNKLEFILTPNENSSLAIANVSTLENFFQDPLLNHISNFKYLPPINKRMSEAAPLLLGDYEALGGNIAFGINDVKHELKKARSNGQLRTVTFDPAPRSNNVHLQFFEQTSDGMTKLDVIDFGTHKGEDGPVRVLFVGKVYWDDYDVETFVKLFTVTME